jgi:hypothetical protein
MSVITLDDYKAHEGLVGSKNDDQIETIISSVNTLVETYCNTKFKAYVTNPYTQYFDIQWDAYSVQLRYWPVLEIVSVEERGSPSEAYTALYGTNGSPVGADWYYDNVSDSIFRIDTLGGYSNWPKGVAAVKVVYRAGFSSIPLDLKLAAVDLTTYYLKDEHRQTKSLGTASTQFQVTSTIRDSGFPDHIRRVLDLYRQP